MGHPVGARLAGHAWTWSVLALAVGHDGLTRGEGAILDDMVVCSLAADPHIWPLKVARLVGSFGRRVPSLTAGILATTGGFMGWGTYALAATVLQTEARRNTPEETITEFSKKGRHVPGFGVPFRDEDERATAFRACVRERSFDRGRHWLALERLEEVLRKKGAPANIAGVSAAIMLDIGFDTDQIDALGPLILMPNYLANAYEGAAQAPEILRQLPISVLEDRTPAPRESPRARAARLRNSSGQDEPT